MTIKVSTSSSVHCKLAMPNLSQLPLSLLLSLLLLQISVIPMSVAKSVKPSKESSDSKSHSSNAHIKGHFSEHVNRFEQFAKRLYQDLGASQGNVTFVADQYQNDFDMLNKSTQEQFGDSLSALFSIRLLDLQNSVLHTRKMQELISALLGKSS